MPSFDVVSRIDMQEVDNAINQARKEIGTRYDFRDGTSKIEFDKKEITLLADNKMRLEAMTEILKQKLVKRGVGVRALEFKEAEGASAGSIRQQVLLRQGIATDDARAIVKLIKQQNLKKVQAQIQDDQVRVNGPKIDDLQAAIAMLKEQMTKIELQFVNFKD